MNVEFLYVPHCSALGYKDNLAAIDPALWDLPSKSDSRYLLLNAYSVLYSELSDLLFLTHIIFTTASQRWVFSYHHFSHENLRLGDVR